MDIKGLIINKTINAVLRIGSSCARTIDLFLGMNQFNQMGMQSMGQRSTPPLPMGATGNQVSTAFRLQL